MSRAAEPSSAERLIRECEDVAERLREVGKDELADAFQAVAEYKRGER